MPGTGASVPLPGTCVLVMEGRVCEQWKGFLDWYQYRCVGCVVWWEITCKHVRMLQTGRTNCLADPVLAERCLRGTTSCWNWCNLHVQLPGLPIRYEARTPRCCMHLSKQDLQAANRATC